MIALFHSSLFPFPFFYVPLHPLTKQGRLAQLV